jgi:uncharacterized damage-inducible protein DinB
MYHTIKEFLDDWKNESEATLKVFSNLTDESLSQKITPKGRSLGRLAWHITATIGEMLNKTGLKFEELNDDNNFPHHAAAIIENYKSALNSLEEQLSKDWTDESLSEQINMYGEMWTKEAVLTSLVKHQIHHRAQMTVIMRAAGLKVPGIYGPSYEEWSAMNMQPME